MVRICTLVCLFVSSLAPGLAQDTAEAIARLNELFSGSAQFKVDRKQQLVIDLFDATGRFRQDIVPLEFLDPDAVHFSAEEDAVVLGCTAAEAQCFTKEIFKLNTVRRSGRCNLSRPPQDAGGEASMRAFQALILAGRGKLAEHGETRQRPARMK